MDEQTLRQAERVLSVGTWLIVAGAIVFSVLTVTPLVRSVTPDGWKWTAPILPIVVDAAVVIVVRLDAALARVGGRAGRWPVLLRWMTGLMTLGLNCAGSALKEDWVGVAVHAVAPLLLIVSSEAGLAYRKALAAAFARRKAEQAAEQAARERREREREQSERDREQQRIDAEQARAREEREHAARMAREEREHQARLAREHDEREREREERQREHERREREQSERERERDRQRREEEARERDRREAAERTRRQQAEHARREEADRRRRALLAAGPAEEKQDEDIARETVAAAHAAGLSTRQAAELCGWSLGWVTTRYQELRQAAGQAEREGEPAGVTA
ncbi:DUF2637 domain-containing protein [Streptomyces marincola]|uniref:DUF2637 domain-containing protein n=1 Tax=Streptomyces marincola TaxID=2878388 RepID=A0A1W7D637_9ACTN|nr:DUF2637 domain-containing protein [Streptomyces marincola]ARQ72080.1 DUF2637 domain-containing protein [Streptomyces marincola]